MSKALESGKAFVDQILAKLPESLRDSAKTALTAPEAADALTLLGDGVLARSDYSKQKDTLDTLQGQLQADYDRLNAWYADNEPKLAGYATLESELARLKAGTGGTPPPTPPADGGKPSMTKEELEAFLNERDQSYAAVLGLTNKLTATHLKDFGEVLDTSELIDYARKNRMSLDAAYQTKFAEQLKAKRDAVETERINKLADERVAEKLKGLNVTQPFPLRNQSPSVLDILESQTDKPANHTLESAVAEYERLQSARG